MKNKKLSGLKGIVLGAAALGLVGLAGCVGGNVEYNETPQKPARVENINGRSLYVPEVVLKGNKDDIVYIKDRSGYWIDQYFAKSELEIAAGILAGTVKVTKDKTGKLTANGFYGGFADVWAYKLAAERADSMGNKDGAVTDDEAINLVHFLMENAVKQNKRK